MLGVSRVSPLGQLEYMYSWGDGDVQASGGRQTTGGQEGPHGGRNALAESRRMSRGLRGR